MNRPVTLLKCKKSAHRRTGTIYDSCGFDIGRARVEQTERCVRHLHKAVSTDNLFLTLRVIHKLTRP